MRLDGGVKTRRNNYGQPIKNLLEGLLRGPFFMSFKQIQNTFFPRFVVYDQGSKDQESQNSQGVSVPLAEADALKASGAQSGESTSSSSLLQESWQSILKEFSVQVTEGQNIELGLVCFEEVVSQTENAEMLDKLVQAVKKDQYRLYQFSSEFQNFSYVSELQAVISELSQNQSSHRRYIVFNDSITKTEMQKWGGAEVVLTYGVSSLQKNTNFKKDLWLVLKQNF